MLDPQVKRYFSKTYLNSEEMVNYRKILPADSKELYSKRSTVV